MLDDGEGETEDQKEQHDELKEIDMNGDGKLSKQELLNYLEKEHNHPESNEPMGDEDIKEHIDDFFEKQDIDNDGVVSYEEFNVKHEEL